MNRLGRGVRKTWLVSLLLTGAGVVGSANAQEYRIQPGDVLRIAVAVGMPDYVAPPEVTVGPDGVFAFPGVGEISAAGKTRQEIASAIRTALEALYRKVDVTVNVEQFRARNVFVLGEVARPGPVPVVGPSVSLGEALAAVGGATANADHIMLYRAGEAARELPLLDIKTSAEALLPGDLLNVVKRRPLMVVGEVTNPGPVDLPQGARLTDALAVAGGLTAEADPQHAILVNHQSRTTVVDLEQVLASPQSPINLPVADFHTLVVLRTRAVAVIGEVKVPGLYSASHSTRLTELLAQAGGLLPTAGVQVTAVDEQGQVKRLDVQAAMEAPGTESDPLVHGYRTIVVPGVGRQTAVLGEVKAPGLLPEQMPPMPLLVVLAQAGGPTAEADLRKIAVYAENGTQSTLDVSGSLAGGEGAIANPVVARGSVVVVPKRLARVTVLGAVAEPGTYTFAEGDTVVDAIALAQGFTEKAFLGKVGLLRRKADVVEVTELDLRAGLRGGQDLLGGPLQDRDVVMVPLRRQTDWAQIAAILFGLGAVYRDVVR